MNYCVSHRTIYIIFVLKVAFVEDCSVETTCSRLKFLINASLNLFRKASPEGVLRLVGNEDIGFLGDDT
jgi:hypothetical protein